MHIRHTVEKRVTKFNESRFLSLVNGSLMTGIERSKNYQCWKQKDAGDEFEEMLGYRSRNLQKVIGNIGLLAENTASVSSFNTENWAGWLKSFDFLISFGREYVWGHGSKFLKKLRSTLTFFLSILALCQKFNIYFHAIFTFKRDFLIN